MSEAGYYDLTRLYEAANKACVSAFEMSHTIKGAINWADLGCTEARSWTNHHGETGYSLIIEEASPDAYELAQFIQAELDKAGFKIIEIQLEW
jgi:hypothetical protein